jgi:hypothetical protein
MRVGTKLFVVTGILFTCFLWSSVSWAEKQDKPKTFSELKAAFMADTLALRQQILKKETVLAEIEAKGEDASAVTKELEELYTQYEQKIEAFRNSLVDNGHKVPPCWDGSGKCQGLGKGKGKCQSGCLQGICPCGQGMGWRHGFGWSKWGKGIRKGFKGQGKGPYFVDENGNGICDHRE